MLVVTAGMMSSESEWMPSVNTERVALSGRSVGMNDRWRGQWNEILHKQHTVGRKISWV